MAATRLVFLCYRLPYPPVSGDRVRTLKLGELVRGSYSIAVVAPRRAEADDAAADALRGLGWDVFLTPFDRPRALLRSVLALVKGDRPLQVAYFDSPALLRGIAQASGGEEMLLVCCLSRMAGAARRVRGPRVLDYCDALALQYRLRARFTRSPLRRVLFALEASRLARFEPALEHDFTECWITTRRDRAALGLERARVVPVHVDPVPLDGRRDDDVVVFGGNLAGEYSEASLRFLVDTLLPALQRTDRGRLRIVGSDAPDWLTRTGNDRLEVRLHVPSMSVEYSRCGVAALPILFGTGIKIKVLEAMAAGAAVVTTPRGNDGVDAVPGKDLLVEEPGESFAAAVIGLLADPLRARAMGAAGRAFIGSRFSSDHVRAEVEGSLARVRAAT